MDPNLIPSQNSSISYGRKNKQSKTNIKKSRSKYYYILYITIFLLCTSVFFVSIAVSKVFGLGMPKNYLGTTQASIAEKSNSVEFLNKIPVIGEFFSGKLQAKIEKGVTAYFGPRETILLANYTINNAVNESFYTRVLPKQNLVPLDDGDNIRFWDKKENILINLSPADEAYMTKNVEQSAKFFNKLNDTLGDKVNIYVYGVTTPYHVPELNNTYGVTGYNANGYTYLHTFASKLNPSIHFKTLDVQTMQEYKKLFFATDHHWNMYGAYKGYQDIMTMMGKENEMKEVKIEPLEGVKFRGSIARLSATDRLYDTFYIPKMNLGKYEVTINSTPNSGARLISKRDKMLENSKTNKFLSCYSEYFGEDYASVEYDFSQPQKGNLLTIGDSTTNCIDNLIASHYNKTFVLDTRLYEQKYGHKLSITKFVEENHITDVLFLTQSQACLIDNSPNIIIE